MCITSADLFQYFDKYYLLSEQEVAELYFYKP